MTVPLWFHSLGLVVVTAPALLFSLLGLNMLLGRRLKERTIAHCTQATVILGLLSALGVLGLMLFTGQRFVPIELGHWVHISQEHFHFHLKFVFDRLSVPFVILTFALVGTTGTFANRYLHRERGFTRFFLLYAMFLLGMVVASLAGTIETLFFGWELVGLSSALLVAYFHERPEPSRNGMRIWSVYRVADAAFLIAAVALHHFRGAGDFSLLIGGNSSWPEGAAVLTSGQAVLVGSLLLIAAAGKSALIPFSGWLPRAMEGPTPSSAIFYGALSVHLGAYLLLRVSPILELSMLLSGAVVALGLASAIFGSLAASVQTDVKSALAYSSLTQVGIITAEIGMGWHYLALAHMIGHACLRTLQLLRAPTLLHDYHQLENAIGGRLQNENSIWNRLIPYSWRLRLYRWAVDRGGFDPFLQEYLVNPFLRLFQQFNRWEQRWTDFLSSHPAPHHVSFSDSFHESTAATSRVPAETFSDASVTSLVMPPAPADKSFLESHFDE